MRFRQLVAPAFVALFASCSGGDSPTQAPVPTTLTLSPSSLTFSALEQTQQLTATVLDQQGQVMGGAAINWASSNTLVATVSSTGLVTALTNGLATITALSGWVAATATVDVHQAASNVRLSRDSLRFTSIGDTTTLTPTVTDKNGHVLSGTPANWASADEGVVTVTPSGLVQAKGAGSATITAASGSASTSIVARVEQVATSVTLSNHEHDEVVLSGVGDTVRIGVTVKDARGNAIVSPRVTWVSARPGVASVSEAGLVTGVAPGYAKITATSGEVQSGTNFVTVRSGLGLGFGEGEFSLIPAGTFQMGAANGRDDESPVHVVSITRAFLLQKTEVTQAQWRAVMDSNPSTYPLCGDDCPVEGVTWDMAQEFITRLNAAYPGADYRLPSEAEWEYAARAGTTGDYGGNGVLDDMGWTKSTVNAGPWNGKTKRVGMKLANAWGLFDMHGNVWEWVQDWYSATYYRASPTVDPAGPTSGPWETRVERGGDWTAEALWARSAVRGQRSPFTAGNTGLRLARTP